MHSRDIQPELLKEWRSHAPYACWLCSRPTNSPHHLHAVADVYWQKIGLSPHWPWNLRPLCIICHQEVKHLLGEFTYNLSPFKRASRIARVQEFLRTFKQERARELVPSWCLEEVMYDATPDQPYKTELEQIAQAESENSS